MDRRKLEHYKDRKEYLDSKIRSYQERRDSIGKLAASYEGKCIRFSETDVRSMGRDTQGVRCMLIGEEDYLFDYIINGELEIAAKPVESIEIIGDDIIVLFKLSF